MAEKCNADLLLELARWRFDRERLKEGADQSSVDAVDARRAEVFVTYNGPLNGLHACNFAVGRYDGQVATGSILLRNVDALRNLAGVTRIRLAARASVRLDRSIPEIKADL